jgi:hypothetical protein
MIKKILLAISLLVVAAFSQSASAQSLSNGPFASRNALLTHAQSFYAQTSVYTRVHLDGILIYDSGDGFGPAEEKSYFTCPGTRQIRTRCVQEGPFASIMDITEYWHTWARSTVTATYIDFNNQRIYEFSDGFGPAMHKNYVYCPNRGGFMTNCSLR